MKLILWHLLSALRVLPNYWALRFPRWEQGWCEELVADVHSTRLAPVELCSGDISCLDLGGTLILHVHGTYFLHASLQMFVSVSWPQQLRYNSGIENIVQLLHYFLCCLFDLCLPCTGCSKSCVLIAMTFLISISGIYQYSLISYLIFFGLSFVRSPVTCLNPHSHG